jgi:hypothetical protein
LSFETILNQRLRFLRVHDHGVICHGCTGFHPVAAPEAGPAVGHLSDILCYGKFISHRGNRLRRIELLYCSARDAVSCPPNVRTVVMIEIVSVFFGVVSVSIFVAHAYEGFLSRP